MKIMLFGFEIEVGSEEEQLGDGAHSDSSSTRSEKESSSKDSDPDSSSTQFDVEIKSESDPSPQENESNANVNNNLSEAMINKKRKRGSSSPSSSSSPNMMVGQSSPPPEIMEKMRRLGGTTEPKLVLQKVMFSSDVSKQQARLLIPTGTLMVSDREFLSDGEWRVLNEGEGEMRVKVIQCPIDVAEREMILSKWPKPKGELVLPARGRKSALYSLRTPWMKVVAESNIKVNDVLQVWSFRYSPENHLGLAVVNLDRH